MKTPTATRFRGVNGIRCLGYGVLALVTMGETVTGELVSSEHCDIMKTPTATRFRGVNGVPCLGYGVLALVTRGRTVTGELVNSVLRRNENCNRKAVS